jgi:hypothetical protein
VLVVPSPKFHDQDVGPPTEVSVKRIARPSTGELGLNVNVASSAAAAVTVIKRLLLFVSLPLAIVRVTL